MKFRPLHDRVVVRRVEGEGRTRIRLSWPLDEEKSEIARELGGWPLDLEQRQFLAQTLADIDDKQSHELTSTLKEAVSALMDCGETLGFSTEHL